MTLTQWLLFCGTEAAFSLSPGPAVLLVISQTLKGGRAGGQISALGVLAGNQLYFLASAVLIATATSIGAGWFDGLRWLGAAWLIWLAGGGLLRYLRAARNGNGGAPAAHPGTAAGGHGAFLTAAVMQLANPKTIVFFVAFVPQFIDPAGNLILQFVILAVSSFTIEFSILTTYTLLTDRARARVLGGKRGRHAELVGHLGLAAAVGWWVIGA